MFFETAPHPSYLRVWMTSPTPPPPPLPVPARLSEGLDPPQLNIRLRVMSGL